jgi:hypothetical protein
MAKALTEATADQHIVISIYPEPLALLAHGTRGEHIMLTRLKLPQGDAQITEMAPTGVETSAIMAVTRALVAILAPTLLTRLATAVP